MNVMIHVLAGIVATTCMTLFSYAYSVIRKKKFREPELLNELLVRMRLIKHRSSPNHPLGWIIHYGVGILFVLCYQVIWNIVHREPSVVLFTIAGAISGVIGIFIWKATFIRHEVLHKPEQPEYFFQLELAHIVFGFTGYWVYALGS